MGDVYVCGFLLLLTKCNLVKNKLLMVDSVHTGLCRKLAVSGLDVVGFFQTAIYGNVLFNDALNSFYLWLYGVGHMVKYHSDSERGNIGYSFRLAARVLLYAPSHR